MSTIGSGGLILIFLIALLVFGPSKLPELGKSLGKTLKGFREGVNTIAKNPTNEDSE